MRRDIPILSRYRLWFVLLGVLMVAGCAALSKPQFAGAWEMTQFTLDAGGETFTPGSHRFSIELGDEGRAFGQVACNRWRGRYEITDSRIVFSGMASTRARCLIDEAPVARLEQIYLARLEEGAELVRENGRTTLRFADGTHWRFAPADE